MASVYKRYFKTFMVHFDKAFRDHCRCHYRKQYFYDGNYPYPQNIFGLMAELHGKSKYISEVFRYWWMTKPKGYNTIGEIFFQLQYKPEKQIFIIHYLYNPSFYVAHLYRFQRIIPIDYVKWCKNKNYKLLVKTIFPFSDGTIPYGFKTEFERLLILYFKEEIKTNKSVIIAKDYD